MTFAVSNKWFWAVMRGDTAAVSAMLANGADISAVDYEGLTALHWASYTGRVEVLKVLIHAGATLNSVSPRNGRNALHYAAANGHVEVVRVLIHACADVNAEDGLRWRPLHWAALEGHSDIVAMLLRAGADVMAVDCDRRTPLHDAAVQSHAEIVGMLLRAGADATSRDVYRKTPRDVADPQFRAIFDNIVGTVRSEKVQSAARLASTNTKRTRM